MGEWQDWIGREELRVDRIDEGLVRRWLTTLDRGAPLDGTVPQGFHWCLGTPEAPTPSLGADGHPVRDDSPEGFLPPVSLPRRMWASSKVEFLSPMRPGQNAARTSRVTSIAEKIGGSGKLVFVDVEHETSADDRPCVRETQSIVYREAAPSEAPATPPVLGSDVFDPEGWDAHRVVVPKETLLFRYSALTFNSHRIHYDLPYATQEEGYRGLVVQGPLIATLLLDLAQRHFGDNRLRSFSFRGNVPAMCGEDLHLALRGTGDSVELGAFAGDGRQITKASAAV